MCAAGGKPVYPTTPAHYMGLVQRHVHTSQSGAGSGRVTSQSHDGSGHMTSQSRAGSGRVTSQSRAGSGRVTSQSRAGSGRVTSQSRIESGRVTSHELRLPEWARFDRKWSFDSTRTPSTPERQDEADGESEGSEASEDLDAEALAMEALFDASIEREPDVGLTTYLEQCKALHAAPQRTVCACLGTADLSLPHRNVGPDGARPIAAALTNNLHVGTLDLSGNAVNGQAIVELARMLKMNDVITQVNLSDNSLSLLGAAAIADMLRHNRGITSIDISSNKFDDESAKLLAIGIQENTRIATLNLSHNEICSRGGLYIGKAVGLNESLQKIDLSWNHIRRQGAVMICKGVQLNGSVTHLNMAWNGLSYEGSLALKALLHANTYLTDIDVTANRLDGACAEMIADGLKQNDNLEVLRVGNNPLSTLGCLKLLDVISEDGCKVRVLDLKTTPVLTEFQLMVEAIKQMREFDCYHGGYVRGHDVIRPRRGPERKLDPMKLLMDYVWQKGLRLSELFRSFDKNANLSITNEEFISRVKKAGIPLEEDEIGAILRVMHRRKDPRDRARVNFKDLVTGVRVQIGKERVIKVVTAARLRRAQSRVTAILNPSIPPAQHHSPNTASLSRLPPGGRSGAFLPPSGYHSAGRKPGSARGQPTVRPEQNEQRMLADLMISLDLGPPRSLTSRDVTWTSRRKPVTVMSLSRPLGAKAKPFGSLGAKRKKRKTKKRTKGSKRRN